MADNTAAYGLVKPAVSEKVDIAVINGNMDKIDAALHTIATGLDAAEAAADSLEETVTDETSRATLIEQTLGYTAKNLMGLDDFNETKTGFKNPKMRPLKPGKYILSYKVNTVANNPQEWRWKNAEGTVIKSVLTKNNVPEISVEVELTESAETMDAYFNAGGSYSEFMLRDARITDPAFEAYKPSFEERIAALEAALAAQRTAPETVQEEVTEQ